MNNPHDKDRVQGEGDYDAARRYDKQSESFAKSGKVDKAAHDATPDSPQQAEEMRKAEEVGKSHSKGEGPLDSKKRKA
ncbi:MAG TPA: hypothetical protein VFF72_01000 [Caldimonas sp.]|nr:hypothetical protein [Caldimonas sp.]